MLKYYANVSRIVFSAIILLLAGCGGSGGSSSDQSGSSNSNEVAPVQPTHLSGTAVKGLVRNGIISAYRVNNGAKGALIAATTSDTNGNYSLTIPGDYSGPLLVEVVANEESTSTMLCDSSNGCGEYIGLSEFDENNNNQIDFGEAFVLDNNFKLSALIPENLATDRNLHVDVTLITHLAATYAASFPQGLDNLSAELAITQVADLFALQANPLTLNVPAINNPEDFEQATETEKLYGLIASSIANLADNANLSNLINQLSQSFSLNQGQLVLNSSNENDISVTELLQASIDNLTIVSEGQAPETLESVNQHLAQLLQTATSAEEGELSQAEGSPTAGSSELAKVEQFIQDLQSWQGVVSVTGPQQPALTQAQDLTTGIDFFQSPLIQAFALASQHSAIVAIPDLALNAACNSINNLFAKLLCQSMVQNYTLEEICDATLNLSVFGVSLCDFLNDLTLPVGHGVWVNYAIYDREARVFGELEGVAFDVALTNSSRTDKSIRFRIAGTISDDDSDITIESGTITFKFNKALSSGSLQTPQSVKLVLNINSSTLTMTEAFEFDGKLSSNITIKEITGQGQTGENGVNFKTKLTGDFGVNNSNAFTGSITINSADNPSYSSALSLTSADMTQEALLNIKNAQDFSLSWNGRTYAFSYIGEKGEMLSVTNQDGVVLSINLAAANNESAGTLTITNADYADVIWINDALQFRLPDNSLAIVY